MPSALNAKNKWIVGNDAKPDERNSMMIQGNAYREHQGYPYKNCQMY